MKMIKLIIVHWIDSACYSATTPLGADYKWELKNMTTCGLLVSEDKKMVVIAKDCYEDDGLCYRGVSTIPKVCITKTVHIEAEG